MPFCTECGGAVTEQQRYCAHCGTALGLPPRPQSELSPRSRSETAGVSTVAVPTADSRTDPGIEPEVTFRRSGSLLLGDPATPDATNLAGARFPGIPPVAVGVAIVAALLLSAVAGYWWFRGQASADRPRVVEATEQAIDSPGRSKPAASASGSAERVDGLWTLVPDSTRDAADAEAVLGSPDQKVAVIAPGGSLAVALRGGGYFYNGSGPDIEIHGRDGERSRYTVFARADPSGPWLRFDVNGRGFPNGVAAHDMGHHGMERTRQIMIKNEGGATLAVDALTPLHLQPEAHDDDHAGVPAKPRVRQ